MFANWSSFTNVSCCPCLINGYFPAASDDDRSPGRYWKFVMCTTLPRTYAVSGGRFSGCSHGGPPHLTPQKSSVCLPHVRFGTPSTGFHFLSAIMYGLQRPFGASALSTYMPACVITSYQACCLFSYVPLMRIRSPLWIGARQAGWVTSVW